MSMVGTDTTWEMSVVWGLCRPSSMQDGRSTLTWENMLEGLHQVCAISLAEESSLVLGCSTIAHHLLETRYQRY